MSDVHLEHGGLNFNLPPADILLLAGDICQVNYLKNSSEFLKNEKTASEFINTVSRKYNKVVWVPGNHEYYDGCIDLTNDIVAQYFKRNGIDNVSYSEFGTHETHDVKIIYATLWTDMKKMNPLVVADATFFMNDYRLINKINTSECVDPSQRPLIPTDTLELHQKHRLHIQNESTNTDKKVVVMTHHAPLVDLARHTHGYGPTDYYYGCTDMEDLIKDNNIHTWVYGHTHSRDCREIYGTQFMSNCRGYLGHEAAAASFTVKTFTV